MSSYESYNCVPSKTIKQRVFDVGKSEIEGKWMDADHQASYWCVASHLM